MRSLLLLAVVLTGCAMNAPIAWRPEQRLLTFKGEDVALAVPASWTVTRLYPGAYLYTFEAGTLQITWDDQRLDERGALRRVRDVMRRLDGEPIASMPPTSFSADHGEVIVHYTARDGSPRMIVHRTFGCGGLACHATLVVPDAGRDEGAWSFRNAVSYVGAIPVTRR